MSTNFWELLQQHQNDLTKSGHMVADYLVQHAAEAQYLSISSLARECKVAEATVFRFCRALGFEGYHEMRIALAQANATGVLVNQQAPSPDADTTTLCEHASALFMTAINGTQNALSPEAVDQAVALLRQAKQVYCMGQGGSMVVADEICARFACVTNKFRATGDSHMQIMAASLMTPQDVVLFVSYSGATRDMMETLRVVKETGAKVILITHYEDSPGAKLADIVLLCGWILGPWWGGAAAGIGSMLVDLLGGYMSFVPGTLIIKFLDAMAAALIVKALGRKTYSYVVGGLAGEAIMVAGYFVYEALALQLGMGAAAGVLANVGQGAVGLVIALVLMALLKGSKALDKLAVQW